MLKELLENTRSFRRFDNSRRLTEEDILALAEAVRLCPSGGNRQRIRFAAVTDPDLCRGVRSTLAFAAYLKDWDGPTEEQDPAAYAVIMTEGEPDVGLAVDAGLCMEAMLLTARERGIGGCIFRSFKRRELEQILGREGYCTLAVIAFGYPAEQVLLTDVKDGDIKYYRDAEDRHVVPKYPKEHFII